MSSYMSLCDWEMHLQWVCNDGGPISHIVTEQAAELLCENDDSVTGNSA